jgi:hypothetical protein
MNARNGNRSPGCEAIRDLFPLHVYGALGAVEGRTIESHLSTCPECARHLAETRETLRSIHPRDAFPREAEVDWAGFARATAARARAEEQRGRETRPGALAPPAWRRWRSLRHGLLAAAAGLAVFAALRVALLHRPSETQVAGPAAVHQGDAQDTRFLQESVARLGAARSLRDGRALLLDLIQAPVRCRRLDGSYDVALEKERSRDLLRRMNLYQGTLAGPGDRRLAELLGQLESLLLQVSALDDCTAGQAIHDLREAIERRQLLMRIDLVTREVEGGAARA